MEGYTTPVSSSARSSASSESTWSRRKAGYSHLLYSALLEKEESIIVTAYELEESHFSSCSTSPNSSCESLDQFPAVPSRQSAASNLSTTPSALSTALSRASSTESSRPVSCSSRYADDHYPLITTIKASSKHVHSSIMGMASAYNTYIRAINSCYNHALLVESEQIGDFLFFNQTLFNVLSHHLKVDQQYLQPLIHKPVFHPRVAIRKSVSIHEDNTFQSSFHAWANYIHDKASQHIFSGDELQVRINNFAPILVQYLHDEISQLNALVDDEILMPEHLSKIWSRFEETVSNRLDLYTDAALLVGCHDRSFTVNGQRSDQNFPRLPIGTTTMVKKWHSRRHDGAWRFCSSDFSGKRRVISC